MARCIIAGRQPGFGRDASIEGICVMLHGAGDGVEVGLSVRCGLLQIMYSAMYGTVPILFLHVTASKNCQFPHPVEGHPGLVTNSQQPTANRKVSTRRGERVRR